MYLDMFLIAVFVALVEESGFWDSLDGYINEKFKFHHLPHLFRCGLCQVWWLCLAYLIITYNLSIWSLVVAMLLAHSESIIRALLGSIRGMAMKLINILNSKIIK